MLIKICSELPVKTKSDAPPKELSKLVHNWILKFQRTFLENLSHKLRFMAECKEGTLTFHGVKKRLQK